MAAEDEFIPSDSPRAVFLSPDQQDALETSTRWSDLDRIMDHPAGELQTPIKTEQNENTAGTGAVEDMPYHHLCTPGTAEEEPYEHEVGCCCCCCCGWRYALRAWLWDLLSRKASKYGRPSRSWPSRIFELIVVTLI